MYVVTDEFTLNDRSLLHVLKYLLTRYRTILSLVLLKSTFNSRNVLVYLRQIPFVLIVNYGYQQVVTFRSYYE